MLEQERLEKERLNEEHEVVEPPTPEPDNATPRGGGSRLLVLLPFWDLLGILARRCDATRGL